MYDIVNYNKFFKIERKFKLNKNCQIDNFFLDILYVICISL